MSEDKMPNDDLNNENTQGFSNDFNPGLPEENSPLNNSTDIPPTGHTSSEPQKFDFEDVSGNPESGEVRIEHEANIDEPVTVRPVEFAPFDSYTPTNTDTNRNLELLMDIKLELTVELGRCHLPVKKVLELTRGSIIELDKVAGESVELYANGKHVANGEVVVIEDNFGLRITSITDPEERIKSL